MTTKLTDLTDKSRKLFTDLVNDAPNWGGCPLFGGNVGDEIADKGNLLDLKVKGLVETFTDRGDAFVLFTADGVDLARELVGAYADELATC